MSTSIDQIETRLRRSERLTALLTLAFMLALTGLAYLHLNPSETLRVGALEILDKRGNVVATLGQKDGRTGLFLLDENATPRVSVFHADDADGLYIDDAGGVTRIGVAQFEHGGGGVALHGPDSRGAAVLYFKDSGSLRLFDAEGHVVREVSVSE
jgi:hypothetical protein